MPKQRPVVDRIYEALNATYSGPKAVIDLYHRRRPQWGGLSAHEMVAAGRGDEVVAWAADACSCGRWGSSPWVHPRWCRTYSPKPTDSEDDRG